MNLKRMTLSTVAVAAAVLAASAVTAAPARAAEPRIACSVLDTGKLCVHVWGEPGQQGTVGVSYEKTSGAASHAVLWSLRTPPDPGSASGAVSSDRLFDGPMNVGRTGNGSHLPRLESGQCYFADLLLDDGKMSTHSEQVCV